MTDPSLDALRAVLAWSAPQGGARSLWEAGQAPDGADVIAEQVARALEDAGG